MLRWLMYLVKPITLDALALRPLAASDLPAFNAIYTDPNVRKYADEQVVRPLSRLFLLSQRQALELLVIEHTGTAEIVGWCGLSAVQGASPATFEVEVFLKPSAQGQGIGAKVLSELLLIARCLDHQIKARVHVENFSSQGLMKKLEWFAQDRSGEWEFWTPPAGD